MNAQNTFAYRNCDKCNRIFGGKYPTCGKCHRAEQAKEIEQRELRAEYERVIRLAKAAWITAMVAGSPKTITEASARKLVEGECAAWTRLNPKKVHPTILKHAKAILEREVAEATAKEEKTS